MARYLFVTAVALALALAACSPAVPSETPQPTTPETADPSPTPAPAAETQPEADPDAVLMIIEQVGGLCAYGGCYRKTTVLHDGSVTVIEGESTQVATLTLDEERLNKLKEQIAEADWQAIRANPFTEECPTAYDGSEFIYTFYTADGQEVISSCEVEVDDRLMFGPVPQS